MPNFGILACNLHMHFVARVGFPRALHRSSGLASRPRPQPISINSPTLQHDMVASEKIRAEYTYDVLSVPFHSPRLHFMSSCPGSLLPSAQREMARAPSDLSRSRRADWPSPILFSSPSRFSLPQILNLTHRAVSRSQGLQGASTDAGRDPKGRRTRDHLCPSQERRLLPRTILQRVHWCAPSLPPSPPNVRSGG